MGFTEDDMTNEEILSILVHNDQQLDAAITDGDPELIEIARDGQKRAEKLARKRGFFA